MRVFVLAVFLALSLFGFTKVADYDVEYGWFKELGEAKASLVVNGQNYHIRIEGKTKGIAKFLSRGREEVYESYGAVTPQGYLPTKFVQFKRWSDKAERTTYL
ncbi:MAG TPA: DUF3108 domain-containing protein, partial [Campylobacterales bacterium]|nr:DUF3108 domain-containing protein [Campylobacterales bacterium]